MNTALINRIKQLKNCSKISVKEREDFLQFCAEYMLKQGTEKIPTRFLVAEYYRSFYGRLKKGESQAMVYVSLEPAHFEKFLGVEDKTYRSLEKRQARLEFLRQAKLLLRPVEYKVMLMFLDGVTQNEIGVSMGVSESRISQHMTKVISTLKNNPEIAALLR
jgi:DNA-binding CsgD family transcriptional regulator